MRTPIFDTLEFSDELKKNGIDDCAAEAITHATSKAFAQLLESQQVCTKKDLKDLEMRLYSFIVKGTVTVISTLGGLQTVFKIFS